MKLPTTATRLTVSALAAGLVLTAVVGCSSSSTNGDGTKGAAAVGQPSGTSKVLTIDTPKGISSDLSFTAGRNDSFVSEEDLEAGARGVLISVTNNGDHGVKLYSRVGFGSQDAQTNPEPDGELSESELPSECEGDPQFSGNQATFATGKSTDLTTVTIQKGVTLFGCGVLGQDALADGETSLPLTIGRITSGSDHVDVATTVNTGDTFAK